MLPSSGYAVNIEFLETLFLSMYTFIIRLCAQRNSCPKVNEVSN